MRLISVIRENLGLKIGFAAGLAILVIVLILEAFFASVHIPLIDKMSMLQIVLVTGILIALFSVLMISIATSLLIQRPLTRLMAAIRKAESGDLKTRAKVFSNDELGQVAVQFNEMLAKIDGLEKTRLKAEHQLTVAKEELRYKAMLEEKASIISSTNRQLEESLKELSILFNITQALNTSIDPEELCNKLGDVILKNMEVDDFAILLLNEETQDLEVKAARGFRKNDKVRELIFHVGEGVSGQVASAKEPVYIPDTSKDVDYLHYKGVQADSGSFLCIPLLVKNVILGVINFTRKDIAAFSKQEIRMLTIVGGQMAIALENARLYIKTKELSLIDDLTRVYNRRHFHKILEMEFKRAKRFKRPLSLLMIDVDHFKRFNDSFGHLEGDRLLVELAAIFKNNLREIDTVSRYGGEEFAVILPNTSLKDGEKVGLKLNKFVFEMSTNRKRTLKRKVTVSVGVSSFSSDADTMDDLINHADIALYKAKAKGRNRVISFLDPTPTSLRVVE